MRKKILISGLFGVLIGCFLFINGYKNVGQILLTIGTLLEFVFIYLFIKNSLAKK